MVWFVPVIIVTIVACDIKLMVHLSWIPRMVLVKINFEKAKQFFTNVVDTLSIANNQINEAVIASSTSSIVAISLKQYST